MYDIPQPPPEPEPESDTDSDADSEIGKKARIEPQAPPSGESFRKRRCLYVIRINALLIFCLLNIPPTTLMPKFYMCMLYVFLVELLHLIACIFQRTKLSMKSREKQRLET